MRSKLPTMRGLMLIACLSVSLTACATTTGSKGPASPPPKPTACAVFKAIYWSDKDTDDTIKQVKGHNAAWKSLCEPPAG